MDDLGVRYHHFRKHPHAQTRPGNITLLDEKPSPRSVTAPKTHLDGLKATEFGDWVILLMEENSAPIDMVNIYICNYM